MNIFDNLFLLQRLDHLIRSKATGNPAQLGARLGTCKRNTQRMIARLRDQGFPIAYDKERNSYYYFKSVSIRFEVQIEGDPLVNIRGGYKKNLDFSIGCQIIAPCHLTFVMHSGFK